MEVKCPDSLHGMYVTVMGSGKQMVLCEVYVIGEPIGNYLIIISKILFYPGHIFKHKEYN